jgi:hypothetical protein
MPEDVLWSLPLQVATGYAEEEILEPILRLRRLHWSCDPNKNRYIADKFSTDETFFVSELTAVSFGSLRFDTIKIPLQESNIQLPNYCEGVTRSAEAAGSTEAAKERRSLLAIALKRSFSFSKQ